MSIDVASLAFLSGVAADKSLSLEVSYFSAAHCNLNFCWSRRKLSTALEVGGPVVLGVLLLRLAIVFP